MSNEVEQSDGSPKANVCVVEATDEHGRVVGRDAFPTQGEADAHADAMRAKGYHVEQSSLAPKNRDSLGET